MISIFSTKSLNENNSNTQAEILKGGIIVRRCIGALIITFF